jgi:hypothetical protein
MMCWSYSAHGKKHKRAHMFLRRTSLEIREDYLNRTKMACDVFQC